MKQKVKVLFIHGGAKVFKHSNGDLYIDSSYSNRVWDR